MNDIAIRARHVSKAYRLYDSPGDRLLDLFGVLPGAAKKVRQHLALSDVSFDIRRGEKIGIIGRNGAGKSTLLKMITRVTEPSSGTLEIHGASRALLQIGTGFHPDFTGRDNVRAYLASLGVNDRDAEALVQDAIAFAELEDFADQPVKTYSTGMGMRLMFAASTMMKPDLLVIDEVLGVGDAYFQRKSFERIREMCEGRETTLLLVTHDVYSAATLCDRMIWIDRGRILIDADPPTVTRAYEDAVREQEERRLRLKALKLAGDRGDRRRMERVVVEIQSHNNQAPLGAVWFSRITLLAGGAPVASARFGEDAFEDRDGAVLQRDGSNWSDLAHIEGRLARSLKTHGSPFHKVAAIFEIPAGAGASTARDLSVAIDYRMEAETKLHIAMATIEERVSLGDVPIHVRDWARHTAALADIGHESAAAIDAETGSTQVDIRDWQSWIVTSADALPEINGPELRLRHHGAAGPYLMMTPPTPRAPHEACLVPISVSVRSGRLGFGALDADGHWARVYELSEPEESRVLEFPAGSDGALRLVLYSADATPLDVKMRLDGAATAPADASINASGVYGVGDIRMDAIRVYDHNGRETMMLEVGATARIEIDYSIIRRDLREKAQVLIAFHRNGVQDVLRVLHRDFLFDYNEAPSGTISIGFDPLPIPPGSYTIPVVIAAEGYYDTRQTVYFSINPDMYFLQAAAAEIQVTGFWQLYEGANVVGQADWRVHPRVEAITREVRQSGRR